jgi:hypothetical protein
MGTLKIVGPTGYSQDAHSWKSDYSDLWIVIMRLIMVRKNSLLVSFNAKGISYASNRPLAIPIRARHSQRT